MPGTGNFHHVHGEMGRVGIHPGGIVATIGKFTRAAAVQQILPTHLRELGNVP